MNTLWAAVGAAAGLPIGAALRGPVFRLAVPSGADPRTVCPACGSGVRYWAPARCPGCRRFLGPPGGLELATAAVLALLLGRYGAAPPTLAFAAFGVLGVALAAIDIEVQRLPDRLTLPAFPALLALLSVGALAGHDWRDLARAALGALALAGGYLLLAVVRPGQMGGGDIKLAASAGLAMGWLGWPDLLLGTALGFILSAVVSLALLAARRITLRGAIPFGPFMIGGALLAMLGGHP